MSVQPTARFRFRADLLAGLAVTLIAIPQCLALALVAGAASRVRPDHGSRPWAGGGPRRAQRPGRYGTDEHDGSARARGADSPARSERPAATRRAARARDADAAGRRAATRGGALRRSHAAALPPGLGPRGLHGRRGHPDRRDAARRGSGPAARRGVEPAGRSARHRASDRQRELLLSRSLPDGARGGGFRRGRPSLAQPHPGLSDRAGRREPAGGLGTLDARGSPADSRSRRHGERLADGGVAGPLPRHARTALRAGLRDRAAGNDGVGHRGTRPRRPARHAARDVRTRPRQPRGCVRLGLPRFREPHSFGSAAAGRRPDPPGGGGLGVARDSGRALRGRPGRAGATSGAGRRSLGDRLSHDRPRRDVTPVAVVGAARDCCSW